MKTQEQCFKYEKQETPIPYVLATESMMSFHNSSLAMLYEGTTEQGFKLTMKVMEMGCCTGRHYNSVALELNLNVLDRENMTLSTLKYIKNCDRQVHRDVMLSPAAERMQDSIADIVLEKNI